MQESGGNQLPTIAYPVPHVHSNAWLAMLGGGDPHHLHGTDEELKLRTVQGLKYWHTVLVLAPGFQSGMQQIMPA